MNHYNSQMTFSKETQRLEQGRSVRFNNLSHKRNVAIRKTKKIINKCIYAFWDSVKP